MKTIKNPQVPQASIQKASGPRSDAGKRRSSKNALTHGLLSSEIKLSDEERTTFEVLRDSLREELQPSTGLQEFLFDEILVGMWKCKIALRLELRELQRSIEEPPNETNRDEPDKAIEPVYSDSEHLLRRKLRVLNDFKSEIRSTGFVPDKWEQTLIDLFGEKFYAALQEWQVTSPAALMISEAMVSKNELLQLLSPLTSREQPTAEEIERTKEIHKALEGPLRKEFMATLLDLEKAHLEQLIALERSSAGLVKQSDPLDRFLRYQTTIKRDVYRAIEKYLELKSPK